MEELIFYRNISSVARQNKAHLEMPNPFRQRYPCCKHSDEFKPLQERVCAKSYGRCLDYDKGRLGMC